MKNSAGLYVLRLKVEIIMAFFYFAWIQSIAENSFGNPDS